MKNTYDKVYEHNESSNNSDNVSKVSKMKAIEPPRRDNLSITFMKKNGKISLKNSRNVNYNSAKNKTKDVVDLNDNKTQEKITEVDLTNETDSNDSNKDSTTPDKGTLDLLSILTGSEHPEEAKLLSQPYVLIQRHSKIKRRKRKHSKTSEVIEDNEGDAANVGANADANGNRISKRKHRKRKHNAAGDGLEENVLTNVGTNAGSNEDGIPNHPKHKQRKYNSAVCINYVDINAGSNKDGIPNHPKHKQKKRKNKAASDEVVGNGVKNTKTVPFNVGANAEANEGSILKNFKQKRIKRKHITAGDDLGQKGGKNIKIGAANIGTKAGAYKDDSSNHSKRKQRKRKRNVIDDDSEENEAQNSETEAINVGTKAGANKDDSSINSKRKQRKRKRNIIEDDLEENEAQNSEIDTTNVGKIEANISNNFKQKRKKRKHNTASDEVLENEAENTETVASNVGINIGENEDCDSNNSEQKQRKIILNPASGEFEEDEDVNIDTYATDNDPEPSPYVITTEELSPDLNEVKFTIVHLSEDQMQKTRDIDRNDRLYLNRAYKCQTCIVGFLDISQCEKHHNEKHSELMGTFVCPICATRFKKEAFLKLHEKTHYRSYSCLHCPFAHHRRYVIETHVVKEHELKPSPVCPDCDMEFDTQQLLVSHYETAHKERLKCNICAETFDTYAGVRKHAAIHKGVVDNEIIAEIYHCARCNCNFEGKAFYRTHMQYAHKHLAQNAYCADCDIQIHKGVVDNEIIAEIYHCARCNCNFEGKAFYRTHMQYAHKHLAQNAYCADCDIQFSGIHKYTQHLEESDKHHRLGDTK
ncbi:hypothetical protein PYW07_012666 [Mythimna separata]|uniref:C2H2-type domain-containing protein n=1 Tax=Mythimna separata TaxID=271217 RepID=A0AAD7Y8F2_MYTSE|nr:hypothetical protein PYW07_012666 [Mythimna separata]